MEDVIIFENNIYGVYITPNGDLKIDTGYHYNSEYLFISSATQWKSDTPEALPKYLQKILYKIGISTIVRPKSDEDCFVLEFANKVDIIKFYNYIYYVLKL